MADPDRGTGRGFALSFAHLHARSSFSYGFGTATPEELVETAATAGYRALAITDRDGLYGIPRFLKAAGQTDISPIIGAEVSMEEGGHLVLLAENMGGYRSLSRLVTAYRTSSADRRRPACPLPTLLEHAGRPGAGLVCFTEAVPFGLLPRLVLSKDTGLRGKSREVLILLREAFGSGNLYAELTDDRTAGSRRRMGAVEAFAREHGIPTIAAHEVTYLSPADHRLYEVLAAAANLSALPPRATGRPTGCTWPRSRRWTTSSPTGPVPCATQPPWRSGAPAP